MKTDNACFNEIDASIARHEIERTIEDFFLQQKYIPVKTPLLSPELLPESSIEFFSTQQISPWKENRELYLIPSPEIWMKRLAARWQRSIFQICPSFRNSEQQGKIHNPEFTMLEWYALNQDFLGNIEITLQLLQKLGTHRLCRSRELFLNEPLILSIEDAFIQWAGFSLEQNMDLNSLKKQTEQLGFTPDNNDTLESLFNWIMVDKIEPQLPKDRPVFLTHYPAFVHTLSRSIKDSPWTERWELYMRGIELANCFTEATDPQEIKAYFDDEIPIKKKVSHKSPEDFIHLFPQNYPLLSGVALGIDRLLMLMMNLDQLQGVLLFPFL